MLTFYLSLYLVTDRSLSLTRPLVDVVGQAIAGGVTMVQLREKDASTLEFYNLAMQLKGLLKQYDVPLIINDRLDIALACDADGLHIGQSDMPYDVARRLLGKDKIIGLSVESVQDAIDANNLDVDYIGISPVFGTQTKTDTATALGIDGVREITCICKHPAVGIGGINAMNAAEIIRAGADGISVVSAIMSAESPKDAAYQLRYIVDKSKRNNYEME
ncbi:thiamine-phosphate pyrophosphorylase [Dysgonomonas sp. PFB1-18]|uniref:thiamine phosphate synthase n=1 Tax=unclassified Dysgonomonas TaxID=2630389 RepID=UPI002473CEB0|nr:MULTISPECIES: thiamine phosphate synthase [unclassified Dysgonomonas]MDH6307516.1 thiamine-phosphate pyrophosphorylase [Dysgonomonas sp. PF1-14]MDH6337434.1 thiamine-phosphate pyrophosphorylase [Dysgonomonas sp. PF1-16]MDH6379358.1 thiamine-phosphate pyrophosphorylase [Dysgonomonas sp. PFB1-18]MDH6396004.1 thiamine-phosphate pyrophosphorylase [Dysgonomonas sp. PF1-23]